LTGAPPKSKWIVAERPDQPVSEIARAAVSARLETVAHYLPLAAESPQEDIEYVHQLRVATRRAMATLSIFRELMPDRRRLKMAKWLKRIRRAAGPARDDDVLSLRLARTAEANPDGGAARLLEDVQLHRQKSQAAIEEVWKRARKKSFQGKIERIVRRIRWRGEGAEPSFHDAARACLADEWECFETAARADLSSAESMHELRIEGKRVRYAMEVFAAAFPKSFRDELYAEVKRLQELLGEVNDHATAIPRLQEWRRQTEDVSALAALDNLLEEENAALTKSKDAFFGWWSADRIEELRRGFARFLAADSHAS